MTTAGLVDFHVHAAPSLWERKHNVFELAERYRDADMAGFVLKSHFGTTFPQAWLTAARVPEVDVYGALALNSFVGGFTPDAVTLAAENGCSVVWFPTFCAANFETDRHFPFGRQSMTVFDDDGGLKPTVRDVLAAVDDAFRRLVVGNGHLSPAESRAVLDAIEEMGVDAPYLITHADSVFMDLSMADQREFAERGAVIEKCYLPVVKGDVSLDAMADSIADIGVGNCVLSTDHGQPSNASPPDAFGTFVDELCERGLSDADIEQMGRTRPQEILGTPLSG
jgi:hypothetical protein